MTPDPHDLIEHRVTTTYYAPREKDMNDKPNRRIMAYLLIAVYIGVVVSALSGVKITDPIVDLVKVVTIWVVATYIGARAVEKLPKLSELVNKKEVKE